MPVSLRPASAGRLRWGGYTGRPRDWELIEGDLLDQDSEALVNPWNRNLLPPWLLWPTGVAGALRRRAGPEPFRELAALGPIPLGGAVVTGPGRLPVEALIHVAGIDLAWRTSEAAVTAATANALWRVDELGLRSVALPLIGAGSLGGSPQRSLAWIQAACAGLHSPARVRIVCPPGVLA